jgi:hypothetical protein
MSGCPFHALCLRNNYDGWHVTHQYLFLEGA